MNRDIKYVRMAIALALKAKGRTSPNPLVGAVVVKGSRVVGSGYHMKAGLPHAEVIALKRAGRRAKGATLYVSLEPCDHYGRTPPCTDAIIESGIRRVVIATKDPNPVNNGRGIRKLKRCGIMISSGVLADEAGAINMPYKKAITEKLPYVTVKCGMSLDGKIASRTGDSKWITSDKSRRHVRKLRSLAGAVMVGADTAIIDDPSLLCGIPGAKEPVRIVVAGRRGFSLRARIFRNTAISPVIIALTRRSPAASAYERRGAEVLTVREKRGRVDIKDLLKRLAARGISNILVEGGGELNASLIEDRLVDRLICFIAPKIIGGRSAKTPVEGIGADKVAGALRMKIVSIRRFGEDIMIEAVTA